MNNQTDIYKDFKGYNSYAVQESERIIRERHMNNFLKCAELIKNCEEKTKAGKGVKILEKVMVLRKKMSNLEKEFEKKADILKTAGMSIKINHVDEERLKAIDFNVAGAMGKIEEILGSMTCAETDMLINTKFSDINKYLNDIEIECRERMLVFLGNK
ncbi:MAG: hypothetical protein MUC95_06425 [Spirochaetes bacterium]|nr:hypothetical protein [Spirochaetota bacterium]